MKALLIELKTLLVIYSAMIKMENKMEDYEEEEENDNDTMLLTIGDDGCPHLLEPEEITQIEIKELNRIAKFLKLHHEEFKKFCIEEKEK